MIRGEPSESNGARGVSRARIQTPVDAARRAREPVSGRDDGLGRVSRIEESDRMT
jgi:hypothetical protein